MKTIRITAMMILAFLYLGGTYGHLSGAAFPIIGTGNKAVNHFEGRTADPVRPTITDCRHMPLVKPVVVAPLLAIAQPVPDLAAIFQIVTCPHRFSPAVAARSFAFSGRAPPQS
jgi:hypothetical protein